MRTAALFISLLASAVAQNQQPEFEVASVKTTLLARGQPISPNELGIFITPGSVVMKYVSLPTIIAQAFRVSKIQVLGAINGSDKFYITAKLPAGARQDKIPEMLQSLLRSRFGLVSHEEIKSATGCEVSIENPEALAKRIIGSETSIATPPREV